MPASFKAPCRRPPRSMNAVSTPIANTVPVTRAPGSSGVSARAFASTVRRSSMETPANAAWKSDSRSSSSASRRFGIATRFCCGSVPSSDGFLAGPPRPSRLRSRGWPLSVPVGGTAGSLAAGVSVALRFKTVEGVATDAVVSPAVSMGTAGSVGNAESVGNACGPTMYWCRAGNWGGLTPCRCVPIGMRRAGSDSVTPSQFSGKESGVELISRSAISFSNTHLTQYKFNPIQI